MIAAIAQVAMLWALAYGQADGVLLLWARDYAQRVVFGCEITPSTFASVPPLFVLAWTALAALARRQGRRQRRRHISQRAKITAGLVTTSVGFALMIVATPPPGQRSSVAWLLACLALLTFGELQVVPLTQSRMGRLVPRRHSGLGYALWYTATALGLYLAGLLGALWNTVAPATFLALVTAAPLAAAARLAFQRRTHRQRGAAE